MKIPGATGPGKQGNRSAMSSPYVHAVSDASSTLKAQNPFERHCTQDDQHTSPMESFFIAPEEDLRGSKESPFCFEIEFVQLQEHTAAVLRAVSAMKHQRWPDSVLQREKNDPVEGIHMASPVVCRPRLVLPSVSVKK